MDPALSRARQARTTLVGSLAHRKSARKGWVRLSPPKGRGTRVVAIREFRGHGSSGDTIPNCLGEFREIRESKERRREQALRLMGIRLVAVPKATPQT